MVSIHGCIRYSYFHAPTEYVDTPRGTTSESPFIWLRETCAYGETPVSDKMSAFTCDPDPRGYSSCPVRCGAGFLPNIPNIKYRVPMRLTCIILLLNHTRHTPGTYYYDTTVRQNLHPSWNGVDLAPEVQRTHTT